MDNVIVNFSKGVIIFIAFFYSIVLYIFIKFIGGYYYLSLILAIIFFITILTCVHCLTFTRIRFRDRTIVFKNSLNEHSFDEKQFKDVTISNLFLLSTSFNLYYLKSKQTSFYFFYPFSTSFYNYVFCNKEYRGKKIHSILSQWFSRKDLK